MSITLLNETCHVILQNRSERFEFFKLLRRDNENNFVIFDCEFNNDFGNSEIILVESYKHLLECLQEFLIPDKKSSFFDINGLIVVIDNISLFYWQLKHEKFTNFYSKFLDLLDEIKLKYKCNIVITSWGSNYEKDLTINNSMN